MVDISLCPDCKGSGVYYPEGFEKGVAKCKHARFGQVSESPEVRRLSLEEIEEHARLISELLGSGYTLKQAERQFGSRMYPEDWRVVEDAVRERLGEGELVEQAGAGSR